MNTKPKQSFGECKSDGSAVAVRPVWYKQLINQESSTNPFHALLLRGLADGSVGRRESLSECLCEP